MHKEWLKLCKRDKYSIQANENRTKELLDFLMSSKCDDCLGTYLTAVIFNLKPIFQEDSYSGKLFLKY